MPDGATTDALLAALRRQTNRPELSWAVRPEPLTGGFWAEMYVVELADPPAELQGRLVARIMPEPATAAYETAVQRHLMRCGFPVASIRCAGAPSSELDRGWSLMDFAPGQPLFAGLRVTQPASLLRRLPDLLAEAAATLHRCPPEELRRELTGNVRQADIVAFLGRLAAAAETVGRPDLQTAAERLAATAHETRVICHGDLHPLNLLVDGDRWTLIDWPSSVLADPHYDLAFTDLLLANPPLGGSAPMRAGTRVIGRRIARRFLRTYQHRSGLRVDAARLDWGHRAHALRALVDLATWEANDDLASHRGHPWFTMRPLFEAKLATRR